MKKLFTYIIASLPLLAMAQVDRTHAPKPGPAPAITIGTPATFTLPNGLKVFVVQNTKLPRVSANLTIDIDGIVEGDKAGLSDMGGNLMRHGTTTMTKAQLDDAVDFLGGSLRTSATSANASSLKKNFNKVFALMSDVVLHPSFPSKELEKIRKQELSGLQADKDDPNTIAENVSHRLVYGADHPYGDIKTEQTLNNVKLEDIKKYFATYWKPNIAYLVFVGDITPAEAKSLATKYFGTWKKGIVPKPTYHTPKPPAKTYVAIVDRPASVQSVITFITPVELRPGAPEAIPASVMNSLLGGGSSGRLFLNLREKNGFTYGAYSELHPDRLVGYFSADASVRNEKTDSAIGEFLNEFSAMREKPFGDTDVMNMKSYLSGGFARSLENPGTIARFALDIARYNLPADYYQNYLKTLSAVTPEHVQGMATKYLLPQQMHIIVVGNAKQIAQGLDKYGEVKYFDVYGKEVAAPAAPKQVDAGVTAQSILQKAAAAVATPEAMAAVKDVVMNGEAEMQGQTINSSRKYLIPSGYAAEMSMGGMTLQKEMLKDGKATMMVQGKEIDPTQEQTEDATEKASFFTDAYMLKQTGYTFTVDGIEKVNDKDAYVMHIKSPAGREVTNYYDVATGLKVKTSASRKTPMGEMNVQMYFNDYQNFSGIQIPTTVVNDFGQFKMEIKYKDVKVNTGLKAEDIK